jgi:hypothetical protein
VATQSLTNFLPFQSPALLLTPAGEIKTLGIRVRGLNITGTLIAVAGQKCVFSMFRPANGIKGSAALAAARIFAQHGSPFRQTGVLICRQEDRFGVWWWDKAWCEQAVKAGEISNTAVFLPEPFFKQTGLGPRILRSGDGFEAQVWDKDFLLAHQWTRAVPSDDDWADFMRLAGHERTDRPILSASPYVAVSPYMGTIVSSPNPEALGRLAAAVLVGLILATTAFFLGQALRLNVEAQGLESKIAALKPASAARGNDLKSQAMALDQLRRELERPDALLALQAAQTIIKPFGYKLSQFAVNQDTVSFELPREASAGVDLLVDEFEASPYFSKVEPVIDRTRDKLILTMSITASPSLGAAKVADKLAPLG